MANSGDRRSYFPKIEAKYGQPIEHWFDQLAALESDRYRDHMAFLINEHGFSQAHANAVAMFYKGSDSSHRHDSPEAYFESLAPAHRTLAEGIIRTIRSRFPDLELVMAWNQPMLRRGKDYVFGLSASTRHLTLNPWTAVANLGMEAQLANYDTLKHTIRVSLDWEIDEQLLADMVDARLRVIAVAAK